MTTIKSHGSIRVADILGVAGAISVPTANNTTAVYSPYISCPRNSTFNFEYQATSGGTVALKIEIEQSNANEEDITDLAADASFVVPDDFTTDELIDNLADELVHHVAYQPNTTKWIRAKITGLTGNDASTTLSKLNMSYALNI